MKQEFKTESIPQTNWWRKIIISFFVSLAVYLLVFATEYLLGHHKIIYFLYNQQYVLLLMFLFVFVLGLIRIREYYLYKIVFDDKYMLLYYSVYGIRLKKRLDYNRSLVVRHTHTSDYIVICSRYGLFQISVDVNFGWTTKQKDEITDILRNKGAVFKNQTLPYKPFKRDESS